MKELETMIFFWEKKKFIQATQIKKRGVANGINGFLLEKMGPCGYIIRKNRPMLPYLDNMQQDS
jgi:hypothetical protein